MVHREDQEAVPVPMMGVPEVGHWVGVRGSEGHSRGDSALRSCPHSGSERRRKEQGCPWDGSVQLHPSPLPLSFPLLSTHLGWGLRISQVQLVDAGTFAFVAVSLAGVANRNFTLQVLGVKPGCRGALGPCWGEGALRPARPPDWARPRAALGVPGRTHSAVQS